MVAIARELGAVDVRPLSGAAGAEVRGLDVASLDAAGFDGLHALLLQYGVLAIHGQGHLTSEQFRAFGLRWGPLDVHGYAKTVDDTPDVLRIRSSPERRFSAEGWHSDVTWKEIPPKISMLLARQVPSVGGDTLFTSQYKAYEDLSDAMKAFLDSLDAVHDGRIFNPEEAKRPVTHPVVVTHPETGRKALYVNGNFTRRIVQLAGSREPRAAQDYLTPSESEMLLSFLFRHCGRERYQCRVHYEPGTLSMWDNRCVQHTAVPDYGDQVRELHRVAVLGDERPSR